MIISNCLTVILTLSVHRLFTLFISAKIIDCQCRWNLTANAARPNPQGSYHYGKITPTKTIVLSNSAPLINGKLCYAVNKVSYVNPDTPLKLADYFNIPGIYSVDSIQSIPSDNTPTSIATSVVPTSLHDFIEVIFQNNENTMQSWHLDGYDFWVVGYVSFLSLCSIFHSYC